MLDPTADPAADAGRRDAAFVRRVLIALALLALAALLWRLSGVLLLLFGAVVVAVVLREAADLVARRTPVPERWALPAAGLAILLVLGLSGLLFGSQVAGQVEQLSGRLPSALDSVIRRFGVEGGLGGLLQGQGSGVAGDLASRAASAGAAVLGGLADLLLVVAGGVFLAADPGRYRRGFVELFPPGQHGRVEATLEAVGRALRLWLVGKLAAMALVGALTALLLWLAGVPSPLALGLLAGLAEFVTFVGPLLAGAVILLAAAAGTGTLPWALVAVVVIQTAESNAITPLVQQRAVDLPPVLSLFAVVAAGVLFGTLGLLFGVPLAVVLYVAAKKLYVRQTLGEATEVPGEA